MRLHCFVTRGFRRLRDVFPSVARTAGSTVFFANGPKPVCAHGTTAGPTAEDGNMLQRRTIASGRSQPSVGKRPRKRQKSRQVTDLPYHRQAATATDSSVVSFAVQ